MEINERPKPWPCHGIPDSIAMDNGLDLTSYAVSDACLALGSEIMRMPPREPWYKGTIERIGRTMNTRFIHWLPGTTFGKQTSKVEYNAEHTASIPYDDFCRAFERYVNDIHNLTPRRNKPGTPLDRFLQGTARWPARLPADLDEFNAVFALTGQATLQQSGFQFERESYNCAELGDLWNQMPKKNKVTIKINPLDIRTLRVIDPRTNKSFPVPCLTHYATPQPLSLHKMVRDYMKKNGMNPDSAEQRTQARHQLAEAMNESSVRGKKLRRQHAQMAREILDNGTQTSVPDRQQSSAVLKEKVDDLNARMDAALEKANANKP